MQCSNTCVSRGAGWRMFQKNLVLLHWPTTIRRNFNRIRWLQSLLDFAFFGTYFSFSGLAKLGLHRVNTGQRLEAKRKENLVGQRDTYIGRIWDATFWTSFSKLKSGFILCCWHACSSASWNSRSHICTINIPQPPKQVPKLVRHQRSWKLHPVCHHLCLSKSNSS